MKHKISLFSLLLIVVAASSCASTKPTAQSQTAPSQSNAASTTTHQAHQNHDSHHAEVNERGDQAMGFSHQKTTHRFRLIENGGAIEVRRNSADDAASLGQIRGHLQQISKMFAAGNFEAPMLTHNNVPPGVPVMQKLRADIAYNYEELPDGGRVRISTANKDALRAVHDFLRFQIADHQTKDSSSIERQ